MVSQFDGVGEFLVGGLAASGEVVLDRDGDVREFAVALDFAEAGFGFEHPGGCPSQAHVCRPPIQDAGSQRIPERFGRQ